MGETMRKRWRRAIPRLLRIKVLSHPLLRHVFRLMEHRFDPERPRPNLEWIVLGLRLLGYKVSARMVRRLFLRLLGKSFRAFVTDAILASARKGLALPGAQVRRIWWLLRYKWGRAMERLFAKHLHATPRCFLTAPT